MWDPGTYLEFADHRGRPFFDLLARVGAEAPRRVVDLGCGSGIQAAELTKADADLLKLVPTVAPTVTASAAPAGEKAVPTETA
mgnify:CR=1 FL=1